MQGESNWTVNDIITITLIILVLPLAAKYLDELPALLLWMVLLYVIYTALSGEAIDPPRPK